MTILVAAVVALALLVTFAAVISGFFWFSERKVDEHDPPQSTVEKSRYIK